MECDISVNEDVHFTPLARPYGCHKAQRHTGISLLTMIPTVMALDHLAIEHTAIRRFLIFLRHVLIGRGT